MHGIEQDPRGRPEIPSDRGGQTVPSACMLFEHTSKEAPQCTEVWKPLSIPCGFHTVFPVLPAQVFEQGG